MINMIVLDSGDNVGVATRDIEVGDDAKDIKGKTLTAAERIPEGHKIALSSIESKGKIIRLAVPVGIATADIEPGHLVHVHNVKSQYLNNDVDHYE